MAQKLPLMFNGLHRDRFEPFVLDDVRSALKFTMNRYLET